MLNIILNLLQLSQERIDKLEYCLQHYDELMQQLNDELDNCNYFGEDRL